MALPKHGRHGTRVHRCWGAMKHRCSNKNNEFYHHYGGRGIKVCERWQKFENFLADMGEMPIGMTLDRIDNDGDYCPENCRWVSRVQQRNNTRANRFIVFDGKRSLS